MKFKIGDRVVLTQDYCDAKAGMKGIIKGCDEYRCEADSRQAYRQMGLGGSL